jgi:fluoride exporter
MMGGAVTLLWVALGGAAGSVARALAGLALPGRALVATLFVNVAGSLLIGWLMARYGQVETASAATWRGLLVTGFCGGFTTFSTFSWQTLEQLQKGQWLTAAGNVLGSVALCLLAVWVGYRVGRV